jgi:hypothetical protein
VVLSPISIAREERLGRVLRFFHAEITEYVGGPFILWFRMQLNSELCSRILAGGDQQHFGPLVIQQLRIGWQKTPAMEFLLYVLGVVDSLFGSKSNTGRR